MKKVKSPPPFDALWKRVFEEASDPARLVEVLGQPPTTKGKYEHWDQIRQREPPSGLTLEQWWLSIKFARRGLYRALPMVGISGEQSGYCVTPAIEEGLHQITSRASGRVGMPAEVSASGPKERFMVRAIIEEAITSSQLEGASTPRKAALEMFRSGRQPTNKSERMIFNNLAGMRFIVQHQNDDLTPALVCEIHRAMTEGTLPDEEVGRLQTGADDRIGVYSNVTGELIHDPPPAEVLPDRMKAMCKFANGAGKGDFLNPIIRSIALHFWLAYDHPFSDGNARTARALFYWSMLRHNYGLFEFISISTILKNSSAQYGRAFQYVETDALDLTYFIEFHLAVVTRALRGLEKYLATKAVEIADAEKKLKTSGKFNYRQMALLSHALKKPRTEYTVKSHSVSHDITPVTARNDLRGLVKAGLLEERTLEGRRVSIFVPTAVLRR